MKWNEYLKPVTVLLVICVVVGLLLSSVNALTAPTIAANEIAAQNEAYFSALPEADAFTELDCDVEGVNAALKADNGAGYVISAQARGYGGQLPIVVAFSPEGAVLNVVVMDNDETPGMGSKVADDAFLANFIGKGAQTLTIDDIDAISGATISSKAAVNAFDRAVEAFRQITGGGAQ